MSKNENMKMNTIRTRIEAVVTVELMAMIMGNRTLAMVTAMVMVMVMIMVIVTVVII